MVPRHRSRIDLFFGRAAMAERPGIERLPGELRFSGCSANRFHCLSHQRYCLARGILLACLG
jgi:hypothetical protein